MGSADLRIAPRWRLCFWCAATLTSFLQIWARRHDVIPDAVSYIEIAQTAQRSGIHGFVNAYWSPLYPALLALTFRIVHPSLFWESTVVHLLTLPLLWLNLLCFEFFVAEAMRAQQIPSDRAPSRRLPPCMLWPLAYVLFIWCYQFWLRSDLTSPDFLVAAAAYLATAILLRIRAGDDRWPSFAVLGFVLGLGYLAKTVMFPIAFVFLAAAALLVKSLRSAFPRLLLAVAIFLMICAPLATALSESKGRFTFGDNGAINYAEFVNGVLPKFDHWQADQPGTGVPAHPTRKVSQVPALFEFATPIAGSYPPWYDPSYWYDGVRTHFSLREQTLALLHSLRLYVRLFSQTGALYLALVAFLILVKQSGGWGSGSRRYWAIWLPCWAALLMYGLVNVEPRYVAWAALMLMIAALAGVRLPPSPHNIPLRRMALLIAIAPSIAIIVSSAQNVAAIARPAPFEAWQVAKGLPQLGVAPGSEVGFIGIGFEDYWAHLSEVRIVAATPDWGMSKFWDADPATKLRYMAQVAATGARAVVTRDAPAEAYAQGWLRIPGTSYSVWKIPSTVEQSTDHASANH
jgi:hypothetical protein